MPSAAEHHHLGFGHVLTVSPVMVWVVVLGFVLVECAFIIGLFLPGDSLLFSAGLVLAEHNNPVAAWGLAIAAVLVVVAGNQLGYYIARRSTALIVGRRAAKLLTKERLDRAGEFLDRHGWWSVVLARWVPWVRTLAPIIAGASRMDARKYLAGTAIGAVLWVPALVLAGYYGAGLLQNFPWVKTAATLIAIALFFAGTVWGIWRYRQELRTASSPRPHAEPASPVVNTSR